MPIYSLTFILIVVCTIFFYRAGEYEQTSGALWSAMSAGISGVVWLVLHGGFLAVLLGQVGLFLGISVYRVLKKG